MNGARRSIAENFILGLFWLSFLALWLLVKQVTGIAEALGSIVFLGGVLVVYVALLAAWVYHNIRIWRKKGPRLGVREVCDEMKVDILSREILKTVAMKSDQEIEVDVRDGRKIFALPRAVAMKPGRKIEVDVRDDRKIFALPKAR